MALNRVAYFVIDFLEYFSNYQANESDKMRKKKPSHTITTSKKVIKTFSHLFFCPSFSFEHLLKLTLRKFFACTKKNQQFPAITKPLTDFHQKIISCMFSFFFILILQFVKSDLFTASFLSPNVHQSVANRSEKKIGEIKTAESVLAWMRQRKRPKEERRNKCINGAHWTFFNLIPTPNEANNH